MTLDLTNLKPTQVILPPRIVIYGPPKIGKTSLAAAIPNNLLMDYEGGSGFVNVARLEKGETDTFEKTQNALTALATQDHKFTCLTIDTIDWLQEIISEQAAREHSTRDKTYVRADEVPYGAGIPTLMNMFKVNILDALDYLRTEKNMMIILLAHECIRRYDNPTTDSYDRYTLKLQENNKGIGVCSLIKEWADAILFVNQETFVRKEEVAAKKTAKKAGSSGNIIVHTQESPAFLAGNRFGLPAVLPFNWSEIEKAFTNALTQKAA
jgi:hypothetical protein